MISEKSCRKLSTVTSFCDKSMPYTCESSKLINCARKTRQVSSETDKDQMPESVSEENAATYNSGSNHESTIRTILRAAWLLSLRALRLIVDIRVADKEYNWSPIAMFAGGVCRFRRGTCQLL